MSGLPLTREDGTVGQLHTIGVVHEAPDVHRLLITTTDGGRFDVAMNDAALAMVRNLLEGDDL